MSGAEWAGCISPVIIGISLGLIGAGGSMLTLPVLVYLLDISPVTSTAYSLFVVGLTSLVGALGYLGRGQVHLPTAGIFTIPSLLGVYWSRTYLLPLLPDSFLIFNDVILTQNRILMICFSLLMCLAAVSMIRSKKSIHQRISVKFQLKLFTLPIAGGTIGIITGLVGAGGGFLIIPVLVLLAGLPMSIAVGTSLVIIAVKSLLGFVSDIPGLDIEWPFLLKFTSFSIAGIILGAYISGFIQGDKWKASFGWCILVMAIWMFTHEII